MITTFFRLVLTAVFLISGSTFLFCVANLPHESMVPTANAIVFGASLIAMAISQHGSDLARRDS